MELFLNLVWISVSIFVVLLWAYAGRRGDTRLTWNTLAALGLLLLLLLPVISMTDDIVAMAAPLEDHPVRRGEVPLLHVDQVPGTPLDTVAMAALLLLGLAFLAARLSRLIPQSYPATVLAGFARATAIRPPPLARFAH